MVGARSCERCGQWRLTEQPSVPTPPARWRPGWRDGAGGGPANICFYGTNHLSWLTTAPGRGGAGGRGRHLLHAAWVLTIPGALSICNYTDKPTFQYPHLAIFLLPSRDIFNLRTNILIFHKMKAVLRPYLNVYCPQKSRGSGCPKVLMLKFRSSHERWRSYARCLSAVTPPSVWERRSKAGKGCGGRYPGLVASADGGTSDKIPIEII